ncbi:MAG: hypothetical protein V1837_08395 [Candidatus Woesearchaeota archaeon]
MSILTIILFFLYSWGIGFSATYFLKNSENFLERNLMRIGIGLGILPFMIYVLSLVHVPIDWKIYAALSLVGPVMVFIKNKGVPAPKFSLKKSDLYTLAVLLIVSLSLFMFLKGAFLYPWLEDGDPWEYAVSAKYIATFKTTAPIPEIKDLYFQNNLAHTRMISSYNEPYPQAYPIVMGLLTQTNSSINWTLKFFNALIISIALVFFYFFAKEMIGDKNKALFATVVLAAVPAFVSHFIYSQELAVLMFFPVFYACERIKYDKKWLFVAAVIIASILMTQASSAGTLGALFFPFYWLGKVIVNKKLMTPIFVAGVLGLILSFAFWGPMIYKYTWPGTDPLKGKPGQSVLASGKPEDVYTLKDFYSAPMENKIDNPIGLGPVVFILLLVSVVVSLVKYKYMLKTEWVLISFLWVIVNFINVNSNRLPVNINPHRGWSFLAIAVAIFACYGTWQLLSMLKQPVLRIGAMSVIVALILFTSGYPKYTVNTAMWPTHYFASFSDVPGYMWLENLPDNTMVTSLCRTWDEKEIGMDMYSTKGWDPQQIDFANIALNKSVTEIHDFIAARNYDYMIIDSTCVDKFGINKTNDALHELLQTNTFSLVYPQTQEEAASTFIFTVN